MYYFILWKKCNKPLLLNGNRIDVCFFMSVLTVSCHKSIEITLLYPGFQCFRRDCKRRAQVYLLYELYSYLIQEEKSCIIISIRRLFTHTHTHTNTDAHNQYQIYTELNKLQLGSSIFYRAQKTSALTYFYFIYIMKWKLV